MISRASINRDSEVQKMMYFIYALIDPRSGEPYYVGKTSGSGRKRHQRHFKPKRLDNSFRDNVTLKLISLGLTPVMKVLCDKIEDEAEAFRKEVEFIALYGRRSNNTGCLTNLSAGGEGNSGYDWTPEQRERMRQKVSGAGNPFFGRKHTPESKRLIGRPGVPLSPEHRRKLSEALLGKPKPRKSKMT